MDDELRAAIAKTDAVLRRSWAKKKLAPPPEKPMRYVVTFECAPSVFERIKQFVAEQPAYRRSFRSYEIGSDGDGG